MPKKAVMMLEGVNRFKPYLIDSDTLMSAVSNTEWLKAKDIAAKLSIGITPANVGKQLTEIWQNKGTLRRKKISDQVFWQKR